MKNPLLVSFVLPFCCHDADEASRSCCFANVLQIFSRFEANHCKMMFRRAAETNAFHQEVISVLFRQQTTSPNSTHHQMYRTRFFSSSLNCFSETLDFHPRSTLFENQHSVCHYPIITGESNFRLDDRGDGSYCSVSRFLISSEVNQPRS